MHDFAISTTEKALKSSLVAAPLFEKLATFEFFNDLPIRQSSRANRKNLDLLGYEFLDRNRHQNIRYPSRGKPLHLMRTFVSEAKSAVFSAHPRASTITTSFYPLPSLAFREYGFGFLAQSSIGFVVNDIQPALTVASGGLCRLVAMRGLIWITWVSNQRPICTARVLLPSPAKPSFAGNCYEVGFKEIENQSPNPNLKPA
jgi:hypothetical protein